MKRTALSRLLVPIGLCLALGACSHLWHRKASDSTGLDAEHSPGDLYVAMAAEYYRLGQMDSALRNALQAIGEDKNNPRAFYMIGVIYEKIGETAKADASFQHAVELSPKNPDVLNAYGTFFCGQRRFAQAQEQFAKALANPLYNTPWVAMTNAGTCAASAGSTSQAETHYRRALAANPRYGPALFKMAELEHKRGNAKAARDNLERYFQANAPSPEALLLAIEVERKLNNPKGAATYQQMLQKTFPDTSGSPTR